MDLIKKISALVSLRLGRAWFKDSDMKVYVRVGRRMIEGSIRETIDIATIEVFKPGQGTFTRFLEQVEELAAAGPIHTIYVENVLESRFAEFFRKRGYSVSPYAGETPCFYRRFE